MLHQFKINPFKAVAFKESAIAKAIELSGVIAAIKYDGLRCHLLISPTADIEGKPAARLIAMSRTDKAIPALRELFSSNAHKILLGQLLRESLYPEGLMIDGEVMVKGVDFNTGSGMLRRKAPIHVSQLEYKVYGLLPLNEVKASSSQEIAIPYAVMHEQVKAFMHPLKEKLPELSWQQEETFEVYDMESLFTLFEDVRKQGHEGLIVKDPMCNWKRGKKTGFWKMKPEDEIDGIVCGVNWGTAGLANEGKVIGFQVLLENGVVVDANGITQDQMDEFTKHWFDVQAKLIKEAPYDWLIEPQDVDVIAFGDRPVQVKYMELTPSGSLRHPSFQRWRDLEGSEGVKA